MTSKAGLAQLLNDCASIIDVVKQEWAAESCWSEWDQSVRDRITAHLQAHYEKQTVTCWHCGAETSWSDVACESCGRLPHETGCVDGYKDAFYQIAGLLDLEAMPISPKEAFETVMLPRLRALVAMKAIPPEKHTPKCKPDWPFSICPICYPSTGSGQKTSGDSP